MSPQTNSPLSFANERDNQKAAATRKRIIILASLCAVVVVARLIVKDPPPPKRVDHSDKPIKALPGMLNNIPLSEQAKLSPQVLAQLKEADLNAFKKSRTTELAAQGQYKMAEPVVTNLKEREAKAEYVYQYTRRQRVIEQKHDEMEQRDLSKVMLVRLVNGRYLLAQRATSAAGAVAIQMNASMLARLPQKMVLSVTENALTWKEPLPTGHVRLKPAKGITIVVNKETAKRIHVPEAPANES